MNLGKCSFCGRSYNTINVLMESKTVKGIYICDNCAKKTAEASMKHIESRLKPVSTAFTPSAIYDQLNEYIIGQEEAKKTLSVAIYNHKKRLNDTTGKISKSNILMAGPSGSGKTLLAKTLAKIIDVPFVSVDATSLTETGYVGDDVDSIILKLVYAANKDIEKAQTGIVYIDEIDKIAGHDSGEKAGRRNPSGDGVQYALLKLIEGAELFVNVPGRNPMMMEKFKFDTSKVLFICGGAFEGMFDRTTEKHIGFASELLVTEDEKEIDTENLKKFGMRSEFIGRLPIHVKLDALSENDLVRILTEPKNSLIGEYQELFAQDGIDLSFEPDALEEIAHLAVENKVGARGLRTIVESLMNDIMYDAPNHPEYRRIVVTKDSVHTKVHQIIVDEAYSEIPRFADYA